MAFDPGVKTAVRAAYALKGLTLDMAATSAGVSVATATRWKREARKDGDDWDTVRAASTLSGEGFEAVARQMLTDYVLQHKALMESIGQDAELAPARKVELLSSLADSFAKTIAASKRVLPETDELAVALTVIRRLSDFTRTSFPKHAPALLEVLEAFGVELSRSFGG